MIDIANQTLPTISITIHKTNGTKLPFKEGEVQHYIYRYGTSAQYGRKNAYDLLGEICRVAAEPNRIIRTD